MGRKIPGRKHRGVKDPEKQRLIRLNSVKGKINAPPTDPDIQDVPHSITRIAELKEQVRKNNLQQTSKAIKKKKKVPLAFEQGARESDKQFLYRINSACHSVIQESLFESKYKVKIKHNPKTGKVEDVVKIPMDKFDRTLKRTRRNFKGLKEKKRSNNKVIDDSSIVHLTKSQKRQRKLAERKKRKRMQFEEHNPKETVRFGDVVHEPPNLNAPRKAVKDNLAVRPGQRSLLLKSLVQESEDSKQVTNAKNEQTKKKAIIDKTAKRKNLPNALRRRLDQQQAEIINVYRLLKKKRNA